MIKSLWNKFYYGFPLWLAHTHKAPKEDAAQDITQVNAQLLSVTIPAELDRDQPLPLFLLYIGKNKLKELQISKEPNCYATPDGERLFATEEQAAAWIRMQTEEYKERQRQIAEAKALINAQVVTDYDGCVTYTGDAHDYFLHVSALVENWEDRPEHDRPAWCYCTFSEHFEFDLEDNIECYLSDNHYEDASLSDLVDFDDILQAFNKWKAKQNLTSYYKDPSRIIVLDQKRYEAALIDAALVLEVLS